jgi:hypothetical protein
MLTICWLHVRTAQSLFTMRTLRQHGIPTDALYHVFQATVITRLSSYASPAWWGFANADDKARLESFLSRSVRFGCREASSPALKSIWGEADDELFSKVPRNSRHLLQGILPPGPGMRQSLRAQSPQAQSLSSHLLNHSYGLQLHGQNAIQEYEL